MRLSTKAFESFILKNKPPSRIILTKEEQIEKTACEQSFYAFCKASWHTIHPNVRYIDGWHIKAICDHFQAFLEGRPGVKVYNVPPRHMKSTIKNMYGAWVWIKRPWYDLMYISADSDLVIRDHMQVKDIVKSSWYQKYWGHIFQIRKDLDGKEVFGNNKGGISLTKTILSNITGSNADIILCFPYETMVQTNKGQLCIGQIVEQRIDCQILSYNHATDSLEYKDILEYHKNEGQELIEIEFDNKTIQCTLDHPIYVEGKGYIKAYEIQAGDRIKSLSGM